MNQNQASAGLITSLTQLGPAIADPARFAKLGPTAASFAQVGLAASSFAKLGPTAASFAQVGLAASSFAKLGPTAADFAQVGLAASSFAKLGPTAASFAQVGLAASSFAKLGPTAASFAQVGLAASSFAKLGPTHSKFSPAAADLSEFALDLSDFPSQAAVELVESLAAAGFADDEWRRATNEWIDRNAGAMLAWGIVGILTILFALATSTAPEIVDAAKRVIDTPLTIAGMVYAYQAGRRSQGPKD
jgi:hypothetical protein